MVALEKKRRPMRGRFGYINPEGGWVVPPLYTFAAMFVEGVATVHDGTAAGFVSCNGAETIPCAFSGGCT